MKTAIVNSKDLFDRKKNPRLCLSALRATGQCQKCQIFKNFDHQGKKLKELVKMDCKPKISKEMKMALAQREVLRDTLGGVQKQLEDLNKRLG